jgi:hypothetical protein
MSDYLDLAGDRMTIRVDDAGTATITFDDKGTGRNCGSCGLCCKLLPVQVLLKAAGQKCVHSKAGKGCTIYADRPWPCKTWSCRWLADPTTAGMPRPDRAHYVIDIEDDYVTMQHAGTESRVSVMQVWCDPAFRNAWDTKPLRDFMLAVAEKWGYATIVRWNSRDAITIFPPPVSRDRKWHVVHGGTVVARSDRERADAQFRQLRAEVINIAHG